MRMILALGRPTGEKEFLRHNSLRLTQPGADRSPMTRPTLHALEVFATLACHLSVQTAAGSSDGSLVYSLAGRSMPVRRCGSIASCIQIPAKVH